MRQRVCIEFTLISLLEQIEHFFLSTSLFNTRFIFALTLKHFRLLKRAHLNDSAI